MSFRVAMQRVEARTLWGETIDAAEWPALPAAPTRDPQWPWRHFQPTIKSSFRALGRGDHRQTDREGRLLHHVNMGGVRCHQQLAPPRMLEQSATQI